MAFRNQNRHPQSTFHKKDGGGGDGIPFDKRRKVGVGRADSAVGGGRERRVLSTVNPNQEPTGPDAAAGEGSEKLEFTKEEVDALLNEKIKGKKFDLKGKMEQITESNKKLKLCIRWFQGVEQSLNEDVEKVRSAHEASEKKCLDMEVDRKNKEDELNGIIVELRQKCASLEAQLAKEQSDKLAAMESHSREKEARAAAENTLASSLEELKKTVQERTAAEQEVASWEVKYNELQASSKARCDRLEEYNQSLQQYNSRMQTDLVKAQSATQRVEMEKSAVVENLSTLRGHCSSLQEQINLSRTLQEEASKQKEATASEIQGLREELKQVRDDRERLHTQVQILASDLEKYKESTGKSVAALDSLMIESKALEETRASQDEQLRILRLQLATANEKLKVADLSASETRAEYEDKKRVIEELKALLADKEFQINEGEKLRKKLHNTILELKGNIRVFCRVRPLLPEDGAGSEGPVISYPTSTEARERGIDLVQHGQRHCFMYDKVFNHDASQHDVFVEISQLVQSALDGYKVCIFAYGQTGSGKTYTMMGRPENSEQKGLIPRSLEQIFHASQFLQTQGWKYKMQASMLEIYNETIRDLLAPHRSSLDKDSVGPGKQYAIKHDANGNTYVSDLTIVDVCSIDEVSSLLQQAAQSRSVGKTHMNEHSSRSHFVFTLRISGVNESTEQQIHGVLNLIDLAGSERLSKSGATGDRLKETQAINKSLSCLADVIFALAKKDDHVPFRNSKLTYLLQPCLGGDSKTLMFVNVSPEPSSVGESLCSLRFASRVNSCEIGIPRRQTATQTQRTVESRLSCG